MRDEHADVVEQREVHQVPVDCLEHFAFSLDDVIGAVPVADLIIQSICSRILDLEVLRRDEQAAKANQQGVVLAMLGHLGRIEVHQVYGMVDSLIVGLEGVGNVRQVVNPLDAFL